MRRVSVLIAFVGVLTVAFTARAQAPDPFAGTWKLDVAKSKLSGPAPSSVTLMIERVGQDRKVAVESMSATGEQAKWGYTSATDGKESPVMGNPAYDTVSGSEVGPKEAAVTYKKAGKVVSTLKTVVSADGTTLTVTAMGTDSMGKAVTNVQVYTKQ